MAWDGLVLFPRVIGIRNIFIMANLKGCYGNVTARFNQLTKEQEQLIYAFFKMTETALDISMFFFR